MLVSRKFLEKMTENWPAKVISVAAALVISVFYRMYTLEPRSFSVPLRIEAGNTTLVPASSYARVIRIGLRGEQNSIFTISEDDIEAYIDLNRYSNEGSYRIPVKIRKRGSALGVEPLEITIEPAEIHIKLENKVSKSINVHPVFRGETAEGFELISQLITPQTITAEGPGSIMENISEFNTTSIDLDGRDEDFSVMVNIINNNPFVSVRGSWIVEYRGIIRSITRRAGYEPRVNNLQEPTLDSLQDEIGVFN